VTPVDIRITDTTLRDGSHAVAHQFTRDQVRATVKALDTAGVPVIEVTHGDGLGGSSFNYGYSLVDELELIAAAVEESRQATIACLLIPGVGTVDDMRAAADAGAGIIRIATHCTEADISLQHFGLARKLGLGTVGFLMLAHSIPAEQLAEQASIMADAGAQCIYVVDSAGALLLDDARERVEALLTRIGDRAEVGYHGHNNLALGVANSVVAAQAGAKQIDGSTRALGAGAGNSPTEVLVAVFERMGIATGIDLEQILEAAEEVVCPMASRQPTMDRDAIMLGFTGAYSSFLLHAKRAGDRYGVPAHQILAEAGRRRYVGGQEDMLIDVAMDLVDRRKA